MSNATCAASKCAECTGTRTVPVTVPFAGTYQGCAFTKNEASLTYLQTLTQQQNSNDKTVRISFDYGDGTGAVIAPTNVVSGHCSPCYEMLTGVSQASVNINSQCVLSPPRTYSATLGIE